MVKAAEADDTSDGNLREVLDVASALGERLTGLSDGPAVDSEQMLKELAEAQQELQVAWELMSPEYGELSSILDGQRADHWWQRKLIATLPMAVLETESDGRIIWANNAAAAMLGRPVLRLVRTKVQRFVHEDDRPDFESLLEVLEGSDAAGTSDSVIRMSDEIAGPLTVQLLPSAWKGDSGERTVITWVVQPVVEDEAEAADSSLIAHTFSQLCMLPLKKGSLQEILSEVARLCENVCVAHSSVSVTIGPPAEPEHLASSTEFAQRVDAAQMSSGEGPCQQSWETGDIVFSNDALGDLRWPGFLKAAENTGLASALAAPIRVGDDLLGVLNVYSTDAGAFLVHRMRVIELIAEATGAVIHHVSEEKGLRDLTTQLEQAMKSREVIEQAKGILMVQYRCTAEDAFARLARVSQNRNIRIREIAERVVASVSG